MFWGQFYFTSMGYAIFDNYRKLSRRYEIKLTVINGGKPSTPIDSILLYYNKNKRMELLKNKELNYCPNVVLVK